MFFVSKINMQNWVLWDLWRQLVYRLLQNITKSSSTLSANLELVRNPQAILLTKRTSRNYVQNRRRQHFLQTRVGLGCRYEADQQRRSDSRFHHGEDGFNMYEMIVMDLSTGGTARLRRYPWLQVVLRAYVIFFVVILSSIIRIYILCHRVLLPEQAAQPHITNARLHALWKEEQ